MQPMAIVATVGTTSTTSIDPVPAIAEIAAARAHLASRRCRLCGRRHRCFPNSRYLMDGVERADSLVVNPHKWLFIPMDLSVLFLRDEATVRRAFSLVPEYLTTTDGDVRNYMDYGIQLGRRFRALKLWFVLRHMGAAQIRERLRGHIALAQRFARGSTRIRTGRRWPRIRSRWFVFAITPPASTTRPSSNASTQRFSKPSTPSGEMFISHTKLRRTLRAAASDRQPAYDAQRRRGRMGNTTARGNEGWLKAERYRSTEGRST